MALRCGHRTIRDGRPLSKHEQAAYINRGECPACFEQLDIVTTWVRPYGECWCCGSRWIVVDDEPRFVIFG